MADFYKKSGFEVDAVFGGLFLKNDILIPMKKIFGKRWLQFHKVACYFCKLDKIQQEYEKYYLIKELLCISTTHLFLTPSIKLFSAFY